MRPGLSDILWGRPETLKEVGASGVELPPTFLDSLYKDAGTRNKGRLWISRLDHLPRHLVLALAVGQCSPLRGWFCSPSDTSSSVGWEVLVDDVTVRTVEETVKTIVTYWVCPCSWKFNILQKRTKVMMSLACASGARPAGSRQRLSPWPACPCPGLASLPFMLLLCRTACSS